MTRIEKGLHLFHANITAEEANSLAEASQSASASAKMTTTPSTSTSSSTAATSSSQTQGAPVPSSSNTVSGNNNNEEEDESGASDFLLPFAEVDQIFPNSPASSCGLLLGDKIKRFGNITSSNHERLTKVAQFVASHENVKIPPPSPPTGPKIPKIYLTNSFFFSFSTCACIERNQGTSRANELPARWLGGDGGECGGEVDPTKGLGRKRDAGM